jgi:diaminopimelate epimerase
MMEGMSTPSTAPPPLAGAAFAKGHGAGNDFVILPDPDGQLPLTGPLVAALCDRRRGIGGDGVLRVVRAARHPEGDRYAGDAEWFMDYWNGDGSVAEMCGNGIRVFCRYLADSGLVTPDPAGRLRLPVATRAGVRLADLDPDVISVEMGRPRLYGTTSASVAGVAYPGVAVDAGNPHLVCPVPPEAALADLDLTRAPDVDPDIFPHGVNVEFVQVTGLRARVRVHERGVGETLACGSGACAVAAVVLAEEELDAGTVEIDLPGGRLTATVTPDGCRLAGPAVIVAEGLLRP